MYLGDIIVYSESIADHFRRLEQVLQKLREHGLKIQAAKCQFFQRRVKYLGHAVSAEGMATDPAKTKAVTRWPAPKTLKVIPRLYIPLTAEISEKVKKQKSVITSDCWKGECQKAFNDLSTALTAATVLAYPDYSKPFIVETDASDKGLGAVLSQKQDSKLRVITYAS